MIADGVRQRVQKRLLLFNLDDAYRQFKDEHDGVKVGLTKFKELRPKNVILAGASGTRNVCVCTLHHNTKLMFEGSKIETLDSLQQMYWSVTYKHLLASVLCNPALPECHLGSCVLRGVTTHNNCSYCSEEDSDDCFFCQRCQI